MADGEIEPSSISDRAQPASVSNPEDDWPVDGFSTHASWTPVQSIWAAAELEAFVEVPTETD